MLISCLWFKLDQNWEGLRYALWKPASPYPIFILSWKNVFNHWSGHLVIPSLNYFIWFNVWEVGNSVIQDPLQAEEVEQK